MTLTFFFGKITEEKSTTIQHFISILLFPQEQEKPGQCNKERKKKSGRGQVIGGNENNSVQN
jgi:hypothetical protein